MRVIERTPAVGASIIEHSVEEFLSTLRRVDGADFVEVRADGLKSEPSNMPSVVKRLLNNIRNQTELPVLLTVRNEGEGGVFQGSEEERKQVLLEGLKLAQGIDVELRMQAELRDEIIGEAKKRQRDVIVSYHDLWGTPGRETLLGILEEEESAGATVAKVATKANSRKDVLRILNLLQEAEERLSIPVIAISLGERGRVSRVVAPLLGSCATYGYIARETAPGQLEVKRLREIIEVLGRDVLG